jgi:NAD-dependent SIR2 family protein deacetylase
MEKFLLSPEKKTVFIMGAGASKDDNIPVQNEILDRILRSDFAYKRKHPGAVPNKEYIRISASIRRFVSSSFGRRAANNLSLESLFNVLEFALTHRENIGAVELKDIRQYYRDLIQGVMYATRTEADIEMHDVKSHLDKSCRIQSPYTELGVHLYKKYKSARADFAFVNFNYDICLDRVLLSMHDKNPDKSFDLDYGIDLGNYILSEDHKFWFARPRKKRVYLLRPHGSVNWLFCRSCGNVFSKLTRQNRAVDIREGTKCYHCKLSYLEPYIVYPSYNRIYENKHLVKIWMSMEDLLSKADSWCFIGYSLPDADKYFTYSLSRIYNYRKAVKSVPEISVVNINKNVRKYEEMIKELENCKTAKGCAAVKDTENYFKNIIKDSDVFAKFGIYFDNVVKYECSFKEFVGKYFFVV